MPDSAGLCWAALEEEPHAATQSDQISDERKHCESAVIAVEDGSVAESVPEIP